MGNEILILRNVPRENPGLIEVVLNELNINYRIIDFKSSTLIADMAGFAAVIVLGGPESANDRSHKMLNELAFVKKVVETGIPYLGICLGLQILVKAMGGAVNKCKVPETGFRDENGDIFRINLTDEGKSDKMLSDIPEIFNVFQLHGETVQITNSMTLLGTAESCRNQIIKIGSKAYGFQCHFELTDDLLDSWMAEDQDLHRLDRDNLLKDYYMLKSEYINTGRKIICNFLAVAGLNGS